MKKNTPSPEHAQWIVYILQCADTSLYTGITNNLVRRLDAHRRGCASKYTRSRRPVVLRAQSRPMDKSAALKLEIRIKKTPRTRKIAALTQCLIAP